MSGSSHAPSMMLAASEFPRVAMEVATLGVTWPSLFAAAKKGNGQPVIVLPGFLGADDSTLALRRFLTALGYPAQPWLLSRNHGHPELVERFSRRLYRLYKVYGKPITLIGQSLGGVFAHSLAREFPDAVRAVITLGSPFGARQTTDTNPMVARLFERMSGLTVEEMREMANVEVASGPLSQPSTSIYSKTDGVVNWRTCISEPAPNAENIEIVGSHTGMAMHPAVLYVVADRLQQDPDNWRKFDLNRSCARVLGVVRVH